MRNWTPEARAAHSALIKRLKPWTKSTGPKTAPGKAKAAKNSYKHGLYAKPMKAVRQCLRDARAFLKSFKTTCPGKPWHRREYDKFSNHPHQQSSFPEFSLENSRGIHLAISGLP